jgi:hypothetical protein
MLLPHTVRYDSGIHAMVLVGFMNTKKSVVSSESP